MDLSYLKKNHFKIFVDTSALLEPKFLAYIESISDNLLSMGTGLILTQDVVKELKGHSKNPNKVDKVSSAKNFIEWAIKKNIMKPISMKNYADNSFLGLFTFYRTEHNLALITTDKIGKSVNASEPHGAAGLNWGYSWAGPALNDAYIPIPIEKVREGYIPSKEGGKKVVFDAIWDDGEVMSISFEGNQNNIYGDYPKQISSYPNKHILGDYLRQRISNKIGINLVTTDEENDFRKTFYHNHYAPYQNKYGSLNDYEKNTFFEEYALKKGKIDLYKSIKAKFITMNHLNKYGRHDIDLTKTEDDDTFFIDFSV